MSLTYEKIVELPLCVVINFTGKIIAKYSKEPKNGKFIFSTILYDGHQFIKIEEWNNTLFENYLINNNVRLDNFITGKVKHDYYYIKLNDQDLYLEKINGKSKVSMHTNSDTMINMNSVNNLESTTYNCRTFINLTGNIFNFN